MPSTCTSSLLPAAKVHAGAGITHAMDAGSHFHWLPTERSLAAPAICCWAANMYLTSLGKRSLALPAYPADGRYISRLRLLRGRPALWSLPGRAAQLCQSGLPCVASFAPPGGPGDGTALSAQQLGELFQRRPSIAEMLQRTMLQEDAGK